MTYCDSLKDFQVKNVLLDEWDRIKANPWPNSEVGQGAKELYQEAREELLRRGIEPDEVLFENGRREND